MNFKVAITEMYPRILCEPVGISGAQFGKQSSIQH